PEELRTAITLREIEMLLLAGIIFTLLFFKIRRQNLMLKQSDDYKLKILRILTHDLRGPLVALTHKLERDHQSEAGKQVSRILQTSDELLEWTFHELQSGQMELGELDPAEVIEEVLANVNRIIPAGKELIQFEPLPEEIAVRGNPEIVKFVLRNIVNNALKFSEDSIIKVTLLRDSGRTRIRVSNSGPGFSGTVNSPQKGKGLGLDLSRDLLARMGATLLVEEAPGLTEVSIVF
ncbi:MAG: HAMP domain-containing sensor histidine kinase, partial [Bacteroidales bacterium]